MKRGVLFFVFLSRSLLLLASNEVAPEGNKLIGFLLALLIVIVLLFSIKKRGGKTKKGRLFQQGNKIKIELEKDRLYYPDSLKLKVTNRGKSDIDLDKPLLVFDNFWLKRKFKIKGIGKYSFYPLYLEKGATHTLEIDITRFYLHDKKLKKYPKIKVKLFDVNGKHLGSKSVYIRKTLIRF